jgi:AmmeMemoRadiSam system protein A
VDETKLSAALKMHKGCFVTLHKDGNLRGCIGNIVPRGALYAAVMDNACAAALRDWRFQPVTAAEVEQLHLEISVLTAPQNLPFQTPEELLAKLRPNVDGVVLIRGRNQATYLPQVWEQLPKKEDFLSSLARKADLPADAWRKPGLQIETYQVELFEEEKPGKATR